MKWEREGSNLQAGVPAPSAVATTIGVSSSSTTFPDALSADAGHAYYIKHPDPGSPRTGPPEC